MEREGDSMKITYIHHSSFMVEMEEAVLLFDYFEGEVSLPDSGKPVFIFASHRHQDHFSQNIFKLVRSSQEVYYVLSDDIWRRQVPEELLGRTVFMGPGEEVELKYADRSMLKAKAYKSTDEGVAFLVTGEGKTIYHAGDLNNWVWEGEPEEDNRRMSENFHRELEKLEGRHIDVAFMVLDPRQEKDFYLGMDDFMRRVGADVVFPMHFWGDFQAIDRFKALPVAKEYKDKIREILYKGQCFTV